MRCQTGQQWMLDKVMGKVGRELIAFLVALCVSPD
jgi:hypothetical protein